MEAGDHTILIGRVLRFSRHDGAGAPLVYFRGKYSALAQGDPPECWRRAPTGLTRVNSLPRSDYPQRDMSASRISAASAHAVTSLSRNLTVLSRPLAIAAAREIARDQQRDCG